MLRFLIADDNAAYCAVLCRMIESRPDWSVVAEANDGAQAVRLAAQFAPDVVLIDVNMPMMNGPVAVFAPKTAQRSMLAYKRSFSLSHLPSCAACSPINLSPCWQGR